MFQNFRHQSEDMDEQEELQQNNMISHLPLLFSNGYPTSLDKISECQLEKFIPFMVQCSFGNINLQSKIECNKPKWWPVDLPFSIPLTKPKKFNGNWVEKLKEIVLLCYQVHKSIFLLRFCHDLSAYEHASLRFINNYNSTTSLFDRRNNKLLVTFRNENMSYDQPQRLRKCLLQQKTKHGQENNAIQHIMVEPAPFDIYLCDNCDAELYSMEAIKEHERTCVIDDGDVILCDTPDPAESDNHPDPHNCSNTLENDEVRIGFLLNFNLQCCNTNLVRERMKSNKDIETVDPNGQQKLLSNHPISKDLFGNKRRISRRARTVQSVSRCSTIPLSSPAGQLLLRTTKSTVTPEYINERLDRLERFCHAPLLNKTIPRPKYMENRNSAIAPYCTFKKPTEYNNHFYIFPRRQFSRKRRTENFRLLNSILLKRCRPMSVRLKKITGSDAKTKTISSKLNIKLKRDNSDGSNWKISSSSASEVIVDTIDLCTSDEEDTHTTSIQILPPPSIANNESDSVVSHYLSTIGLNGEKPQKTVSSASLMTPLTHCTHNNSIQIPQNQSFSSFKRFSLHLRDSDLDKKKNENVNSGNILANNVNETTNTEKTEKIEKTMNVVKPLMPSLYILSNYGSKSLTAIVSTPSKVNSSNIDNSNQSNVNWTKGNTASLLSTNGSSMWFNSVHQNEIHTDNANKTPNLILESKHNSHNSHAVHPKRIISIDLTS